MNDIFYEYAKALYFSGALRISKESFQLRSGGESHVYCDHRKFILDNTNFSLLIEVYAELLKKFDNYDSLCSMDSVCSPIITGALVSKNKYNLVITQKEKLSHGTKQQSWVEKSQRTVCVDDIITSGNLLLKTINILHSENVVVVGAVSPIIRNKLFLKDNPNLNISTFGNLEDLINEIREFLSKEELKIVRKEGFLR